MHATLTSMKKSDYIRGACRRAQELVRIDVLGRMNQQAVETLLAAKRARKLLRRIK